jgi:hypothetical protein
VTPLTDSARARWLQEKIAMDESRAHIVIGLKYSD